VDASYVGRRGANLQREFNINQLSAGTLQANPNVNIAALRPYTGYGAIRISENNGRSTYHSLQLSADRRYRNGLKLGAAYTLSKSMDDGSNKRDVVFNTYDPDSFWGPSIYDRRHVLTFHYIYDIPYGRDRSTAMKKVLGGWQISGATFLRTGTPLSVLRTNDIAGVGDGGFGQPYNLVGDPKVKKPKFSEGAGLDNNFWFNPAAFAAPATRYVRQCAAQSHLPARTAAVGHRALQELRPRRDAQLAVPGGVLQLPEPSEPEFCANGTNHWQQRGLCRSDQRELRTRDVEDQRPAGHSVESQVHLLTRAIVEC
jgi:hypothetical protein